MTFANDQDCYLPNLKREGNSIDQSLRLHQKKSTIIFKKEVNTSIDDIFNLLKDFGEGLHIFHYGGHANGVGLQLESFDGQPEEAQGKGLSGILGEQANLKLVFLNGCATKGHVDLLFEAGVPLVIATSVSIDDKNATDFAEQFYEYLATNRSIQQAFNSARAFIETKTSSSPHRAVYWAGKTESAAPSEAFPWDLYVNRSNRSQEDIEEALNWKPPSTPTPTIVVADSSDYGNEEEPYSQLLEMLLGKAVHYNSDLADKVIESKKYNTLLPWRHIKPTIIYSLPMPISEHLRMLLNSTGPGMERLKLMVNTYNACVQLICFTFLSQLWDCLHKKKFEAVRSEHLKVLYSFFGLTRENTATFNYLKLAITLLTIFKEKDINPFINDFKELPSRFVEGDEFYQAHLFFEGVKNKMAEDPEKIPGFDELSSQGIHALGIILLTMSPIMKYKITSIKRVEVERVRYRPAKYNHKWVIMDVRDPSDESIKEQKDFADHNSVIILELIKNSVTLKYEENIFVDNHLSLSPFVIDENALKNTQKSKLFFYQSHDNQTNEYHYSLATKLESPLVFSSKKSPSSGPLRINFNNILELQERFRTAILSINKR